MKKFVLFLSVFIPLVSAVADAQNTHPERTVTLVADEWCPYNCQPDSEKPGYIVEIARKVFEHEGYQVVYSVMPWERAIEETRKGTYNGIIGALTTDAPDFVIPAEPVGSSTNTFFVRSDSAWQYTGIASLKDISLGIIEGYSYGPDLDRYIAENKENSKRIQSVAGDAALSQNFKKLKKGRIDAYLEDANVAMQYIADNSLWGKFKSVGAEEDKKEEQYLYISFSPVNKDSDEYAKILSEGIKRLRKSGELKNILNRYNVRDWNGPE